MPSSASRSEGFGAVLVYDVDGVGERWRLQADRLDYDFTAVAFSPDGSVLLVLGETEGDGANEREPTGLLVAYDATSGAELGRTPIETEGEDSLEFTDMFVPLDLGRAGG